MRHLQRLVLVLFASGLLMSASPAEAQVTTATLVGLLRDSSGAVIPGATVVATHEGTRVAREATTDVNGEFVLSALPNGARRTGATQTPRTAKSERETLKSPGGSADDLASRLSDVRSAADFYPTGRTPHGETGDREMNAGAAGPLPAGADEAGKRIPGPTRPRLPTYLTG